MRVPKSALPLGQLEWNGVPLTYSHWPNTGLGYARKVFDKGAVYADGRTKGPKPKCHLCENGATSTQTAPCGANISFAEQPSGNWAAEMKAGPGFGAVSISGYFSADWYHESHIIAKVVQTASNTSVQMASFSRYGFCEALEHNGGCGGSAPGRFTVQGLLSEVDYPGEYFFDTAANVLYIYPATPPGGGKVKLGYWHGPGLITLNKCNYVTVRDVQVSGCAKDTAITISGGANNTVGGCTLRNSRNGVTISGGTGNKVVGNDIYDVGGHISMSGEPSSNLQNFQTTTNLVANNHLTQVYLRGHAWQLRVDGMGSRFSHNLAHDSSSQLMLPGGPLVMTDRCI